MITKKTWEKLEQRMEELKIAQSDLVEKFVQGSGSGGQKVNKTSSCVYLKHIPTGFEIKCQKERGREANRYHARKDLCDKIEEEILQEKSKKQQEIAKIRKQKKRRSRKVQQKLVEEKRHRSTIKAGRKPPRDDES